MKRRRVLLLLLLGGFLLFGCGDPETDLVISPTELPPEEVGQYYRAIITISENDTPVGDMFIESGTLPPGLTFTFPAGTDSAGINGIPTEAGVFEFTVSAWCFGTNVSGDTGRQRYTLTVR